MTSPRYAIPDDFDIIGIIKKLQAEIIALQRQNNIGNTALDSGAFVVKSGNINLFVLGDLGKINVPLPKKPDGNPQMAFRLTRDTGEVVLLMMDANTTDGYQQALNWYDRSGNIVVADDTNGGWGLARPYIGNMGVIPSNAFSWQYATTSTFSDLCEGYLFVQHPKVNVNFVIYNDGGIAGEGRLLIDGQQYGPTIASTTAGGFTQFSQIISLPQSMYNSVRQVKIQARLTSGTGNVYGVLRYAIGRQT